MRAAVRALLCMFLALCWAAVASTVASATQEGLIERFPIPVAYVESLGEITGSTEGGVWFTRYHEYLNYVEHVAPNGDLNASYENLFAANPYDLTQGPDDSVWFISSEWFEADPGEEMVRLGEASVTGGLSYPPTPQPNSAEGEWTPMTLTEGPEGAMWLVEYASKTGKVVFTRIATSGATSSFSIPTGEGEDVPEASSPAALVAGPEGDIWFVDDGHNALGENFVGRITPSGEVKEFPIPMADSDPCAIAVSTEGTIWFEECAVSKIGRISPSGAVQEFDVPSLNVPSRLGQLHSLARGPSGTMWFTTQLPEEGVGWISPSGEVHRLPQQLLDSGRPATITTGVEGDPWYLDEQGLGQGISAEFYATRLVVPPVPTATADPSVTGTTLAGSLLKASSGEWAEAPTSLGYQWELCGPQGGECGAIPGATSEGYFLGSSDVGHTLRVLVTDSDLLGSTSSASLPTAVVGSAGTSSPPPSTSVQTHAFAPTPTLGVTISWLPVAAGKATRFASLVAHGLKPGTAVALSCDGRKCPFRHVEFVAGVASTKKVRCVDRCAKRRFPAVTNGGALDLTPVVSGARLQRGSSLMMRFARAGWLGQTFRLSVKAQHEIAVEQGCLVSGSLVQPIPCGET